MPRTLVIITLCAVVGFSTMSARSEETAVNDTPSASTPERRDPCADFSRHKNKPVDEKPSEKKVGAPKQKEKTPTRKR